MLVQELGEHSDEESIGIVEESDAEVDEDIAGFQENYNSLLEKSGEYARVAKTVVKKMKKAEEDYRSLLVRYKEAKCEIETLTGELTEAYTKVKFLSVRWFKQMPKYTESLPRSLMMSSLLKKLSPTKPGWDMLEKVVRMSR